nr:cation diffusion facilitator family transporter [Hymenobacter lucidus]
MSGSAASRNKRALTIVFFTTLAYLIAEVIGGWCTGSLALLADAGHMLTDVAGVGLALLAIRFGEKPATPERTYGYYRFEILAALTNAVVLILISLYILYEAYFRFLNPPKVESTTMMWVAGVGMLVNLYGVYLLRKSSGESLNMKGAYFEVLSDLLTSVGVLIAGAIMITTQWYYADPLLSAGIGLFILPRTWALLKESVNVLLEGTPADVNLETLRQGLLQVPGVAAVHDLHAWVLTSGVNALSVHVVLTDEARHEDVLARAHEYVTTKHPVQHATVQVERGDFAKHETHL